MHYAKLVVLGGVPLFFVVLLVRFSVFDAGADDAIRSCGYGSGSGRTLMLGLHGVQGRYDLAEQSKASIQRAFISWQVVEPRKGQYDFSRLDDLVKGAGAHGIETAVTVRVLSEWGSNREIVQQNREAQEQQSRKERGKRSRAVTTRNSFPNDIDAWLKTIEMLAERYDGDGRADVPGLTLPVRYWQIENEVSWQWQGPMESYVALLRQTREAIHRANPQAKIILGAITAAQFLALDAGLVKERDIRIMAPNGKREVTADEVRSSPRFREMKTRCETLFAKAGPFFDIADFHSYSDDARLIAVQAAWMQHIMRRNGYERPLWCQECGGPVTTYSTATHVEQVVKRVTIAFASGVQTVMWSTLMPTMEFQQKYINLSLCDTSGKQKPAFSAFQMMAKAIRGCNGVTRLQSTDSANIYEFGGARKWWVVWGTKEGTKTPLSIRLGKVRVYTITTSGRIQSREMYLRGKQPRLPASPRPILVESLDEN